MNEKESEQRHNSRIRLIPVVGLMVLFWVMLVIRAVDLHVLQADSLQERANKQHFRQYAVAAPRGEIKDRLGRTLSKSIEVPSLGAMANEVPKERWPELAQALQMPLDKLTQRLQHRTGFTWLVRQTSPTIAKQVMALEIRGVREEVEWQRYYPLGPDVGHLLGFVGIDGHGLEGVEHSFDAQLLGQDGVRLIQRDAHGSSLPGGSWLQKPYMGQTLNLTIDSNIQSIAYAALSEGVRSQKAQSGSVVVMDPHTGDILAMASWPGFNPNSFGRYRPKQWRNRAITDIFEPGSTMKPFTLATALESGQWRPTSRVFCEHGSFQVADYTIHDDHDEGWLDLTGVLERSSNIGAAKVGLSVGAEKLWQTLDGLGFGRRPELELSGGTTGLLASQEKWGPVETANIAFGQGVAVTALQLATAFSTLANDGVRVHPRLLISEPVVQDQRIFSEQTTHAVEKMLVAATSRQGTGFKAVPEGYHVAGKTGTAQKANAQGGYAKDKFTAVFAGFAPAEAPAVVIVVVVDEPQKSIYGGTAAAPVFRDIAAATLPYLGVLPALSVSLDFHPPMSNEPKKRRDEANGGLNFLGLSLREAYRLAEQKGYGLRTHGSGWVFKQSKPVDGQEYQDIEVWLHE